MYNVEIRQKDTSVGASFFVYVWRVEYVKHATKYISVNTNVYMGERHIYTR